MKDPIPNYRLSNRIKTIERAEHKMISELGIHEFESLADTQKRQRDMFCRLDKLEIDTTQFEDVRSCQPDYCSRQGCSAGCHFTTRSIRLQEIAFTHECFRRYDSAESMITIAHPLWEVPLGRLSEINIAAARQWLYRRLQKMSVPILAKGSFEVSLNRDLDGRVYWAGQIHLIIAGASRWRIRKAFRLQRRYHRKHAKPIEIKEVNDLGYQLGYCLKRLPQERRAYISDTTGRQNRRKLPLQEDAHWVEHDLWLMGLAARARIISHGFKYKKVDEC